MLMRFQFTVLNQVTVTYLCWWSLMCVYMSVVFSFVMFPMHLVLKAITSMYNFTLLPSIVYDFFF